MKKIYLFLLMALSFSGVWGQYSLTGTTYSQSFDGLGTATATVAGGNLNNLSTTLNGWYFSESGTGANTTITVYAAGSNSGDTYNLGTTGGTDRSLGCLQSGSVIPAFGFYFTNNTGAAISALAINYTGETWRVGTANRSDRLDFQYSLNATSLATGTWVDVDALDYANPGQATGAGSIQHSAAISGSITGLSLANGSTIFIRFTDFNATSADDAMGVNNFSLTATSGGGAAAPTVTLPTATAIDLNTATLGATVASDGGDPLTEKGVVWSVSPNTDPVIGGPGVTTVPEGTTATGAYTVSVTGLPAATTVYYKGYATNSVGTSYTSVSSFTTLKGEPTDHATAFACGITTSSSIPLTWTDATGAVVPDGYLIKWNSTGFGDITAPVDGTPESNGAGVRNVAAGDQSLEITGLAQTTTYYFQIFPYTNSGTSINYKVDGAVPQTSCTTTSGPWEDFEQGNKTSYAAGDVTCSAGSWNMTDALLGTAANDKKNGVKSVRMQNTGSITMNFDIAEGASVVRIYHANYGSDPVGTWQLEASADGGATWTAYVSAAVTSSATLTPETFTVNLAGPVRFRIVKLAGGDRINIDDITYTPFGALPVNFSNVKAVQQGSGIKIGWSNLTERNVTEYAVERSADGQNFTAIGRVDPVSNNGDKADYSYFDAAPLGAVNFYRIRSVETNGRSKQSIVVRVEMGTSGVTTVVVYPNPAPKGQQLSLQATSLPRGQYNVRVISMTGQQLSTQVLTHPGGSVTEAVNLPATLNAGVYQLQVSGTETRITRTFMIK